jgi:3'(2'), 5'-bisphosphate nucleotidase
MEIYNGPDFEVRAKGDSSPVTAADEAADAVISAGLRAAFPGCAADHRRTGRHPTR